LKPGKSARARRGEKVHDVDLKAERVCFAVQSLIMNDPCLFVPVFFYPKNIQMC